MNLAIIDHTFIKFIFVGVLNTLFGYLTFSLLIFLGLHYYLAFFLATCVGILFNFKTFGTLVFNNSEKKLLVKFIAVYLVVYLINIAILKSLLIFIPYIYL